jgi:hypothetical protein
MAILGHNRALATHRNQVGHPAANRHSSLAVGNPLVSVRSQAPR